MTEQSLGRREFLRSGGSALTSSILVGNLRGANDRINGGFVGVGSRGKQLLTYAMTQPSLPVVALCDVKQDSRETAEALVANRGHKPKIYRDFREMFSNKDIDFVCIATPDHWHPYLTVEACKAGKDVYVEKPLCCGVNEGQKMVEAARKYNRIVETGTWQRSAEHFQRAAEFVRTGRLGKLFLARAFNYFWNPPEGDGNPPDSAPPPGIDWNAWLGPAPRVPYNEARAASGSYRKYWDYGGGVMTDWGVHWMDIVQLALGEAMAVAAAGFGGKYWFTDSRDVPDTLQVTFQYPNNVLAVFETRAGNAQSLGAAHQFTPSGRNQGIVFYGSKGTMFLDRFGYKIIPERKSDLKEEEVKAAVPEIDRRSLDLSEKYQPGGAIDATVIKQWKDFLECLRTRRKPASDVENCFRSTVTCILGNAAVRSGLRVNFDSTKFMAKEPAAQKYLVREYRAPWKLVV